MVFGPQTHLFCRYELTQLRLELPPTMLEWFQQSTGPYDLMWDMTQQQLENAFLAALNVWWEGSQTITGVPLVHSPVWSRAIPPGG